MNLYQEEILEHYHNPRNAAPLKNPTHAFTAHNPTCGDSVRAEFVLKDDVLKEVSFSGEGCAISQAAASLLSEQIKGKSFSVLKNTDKNAMLSLLGLELSPNRLKCGLLALESAKRALEEK